MTDVEDREPLHIAVGVLVAGDGRVLIAQRRAGTPGAGKWEFPGGKREGSESIRQALARELHEELGVQVEQARPLIRFTHTYSDRTVLLDIWRVTRWQGRPDGKEGQRLAWAPPGQLFDYDLLSANRPVVNAIRLPERYAITPEPAIESIQALEPGAFVWRVQAAMAQGCRLLRLRAPCLPCDEYESLARQLQILARHHNAQLILDRDPKMVVRVGAAGLHLPAARLREFSRRPIARDYWFAASCHDREQLLQAHDLGADFTTLSPLAATASHPGATPLGWAAFARLRGDIPMPIYALGGLGPDDYDMAWQHGGQGVAGIRRFV